MAKTKHLIRSYAEIVARINEVEMELEHLRNWYKKASDEYYKDKRFWGKADDSEMRVASSAVEHSRTELKLLKWVINQ